MEPELAVPSPVRYQPRACRDHCRHQHHHHTVPDRMENSKCKIHRELAKNRCRVYGRQIGCIVASFIPLSKPLSITVTIIPSSRPLQAGFRLVILVLSMTSSELIMVFATVFCKYDTGFSSNHSISSCKANH